MGKPKKTAKSPRSQKKKATSKEVPTVFAIPPIPTQEIERFDKSPTMTKKELNELLDFIKVECEDSLLLGGYEESIIGYDYNTKAIIYDGDKILNRMADDAIQEAFEDGIEIFDRWEYYYDAVDYFEYNVLGFFDCSPTEEDRPKPIILRRFN